MNSNKTYLIPGIFLPEPQDPGSTNHAYTGVNGLGLQNSSQGSVWWPVRLSAAAGTLSGEAATVLHEDVVVKSQKFIVQRLGYSLFGVP